MKVCSKCKATYGDEVNFCAVCGEKLIPELSSKTISSKDVGTKPSDQLAAERMNKISRRKRLRQTTAIVAIILISLLCVILYFTQMKPIPHKIIEVGNRESIVKSRLLDIRDIQVAYLSRYGHYTASFDTLVRFVLNDSLPRINSWTLDTIDYWINDTIAWISVRDSIFKNKNYPLDSLPYVPFSKGERYEIEAGIIERGMVTLPVFMVYTLPEQYLYGVKNPQHASDYLIIGSMVEYTTKGSWEQPY